MNEKSQYQLTFMNSAAVNRYVQTYLGIIEFDPQKLAAFSECRLTEHCTIKLSFNGSLRTYQRTHLRENE